MFKTLMLWCALASLVAPAAVTAQQRPAAPAPAVTAAPERGVDVRGIEQPDGSYRFVADNTHFIPMWIEVDFQRLVNFDASVELPFRVAVPPGAAEMPLFELTVRNPRAGRSYSLLYGQVEGDPSTAQPDGYLYLFPFDHGTKHRITQGYEGAFSHFDDNRYAIDFDLPEGTPVHAARGGVVVRVKDDSRRGGPSAAYARDGNLIMVAHADGTFGNYVHLRYRGSLVAVGDTVEAGQHIGFSGNTGVSSGPHLHFDVRVPTVAGRMQSVPFHFRGPQGQAVEPHEGHVHYAVHPGGAPFEMIFGADLTNADFSDHRRAIGATGRIEFRTEEFDLTYAVFVGNGFADEIEATIEFRLVGMTADADLPLTVRVPARTEVFVTLLRADPRHSRWQYAPTVRYRPLR